MANRIVLYDGGKNPTLVGTADNQVPTWNNTTQEWTAQAGGGGSGTVTGVTAGTGLNVGAGPGGTITTSGTLNLANTAVTPASYGTTAAKTASFTVDAQGRLTAASETDIAIAASQVTSGTFSLSQVAGPTGVGFGVTSSTGVWAAASISGTDQLVGFNGTTPAAITIGSGLSLTGGTLSATGGAGTVTSITLDAGTTGLTVSGGSTQTITTSGTFLLAGTLAVANGGTGAATAAANTVFAGPATVGPAAPSFRQLYGYEILEMPYDFGGEYPGTPEVNEECFHYVAVRDFTLPLGTLGKARCVGTASAVTVFDIQKSGVSIGDITFQSGQNVGVLTIDNTVTVAIGQPIVIVAPAGGLNGIDTIFWQFYAYI